MKDFQLESVDKQRMGLDADSGLFTYGYDKLDRLVSVGHGGNERVYSYDGLGNRVASVDNGVVTGYTYDIANRLTTMEAGGVRHGYGYDGRGNLSEVTSDGVVTARYTFDATNRLTEAVTGAGTARYGYNGMLARVMKTEEVDGLVRETRHTLDMTLSYDNLLMEDDGRERSFVWGNGLIAATGGDSDSNSNMFYFHDHLGSPVRLMGSVGDTVHGVPMAYDEFGGRLHGTDAFKQPFGFTGYQDEDVTGLYYAQARYYEPGGGRFIAPDTHWHPGNMIFGDGAYGFVPDMGAIRQSSNLHMYVMGNPLRFVDRGGLWGEPVHRHDTKRWAIEVGFSKRDAKIIALANKRTDFGKSGPLPLQNQSYHFNRYEDGDSREIQSEIYLYNAANIYNTAWKKREELLDNLCPSDYNYIELKIHYDYLFEVERVKSLKELGRGVHLIQDIYAHGQIDSGKIIAQHAININKDKRRKADNKNYDWIEDGNFNRLVPSTEQKRWKNTREETKNYFRRYKCKILY
jgi:RHS repeat-associated protein